LFWLVKGLGSLWYDSLLLDEGQTIRLMQVPQPFPLWVFDQVAATPVSIERGQTTRIRIEIPAGLESKVAAAVAASPTAHEFEHFALPANTQSGEAMDRPLRGESPLFQIAKVIVVGAEPAAEGARP
jgi:hypothetical protein